MWKLVRARDPLAPILAKRAAALKLPQIASLLQPVNSIKIQQHRHHADLREDLYVSQRALRPLRIPLTKTAVTGKTITLEVESSDTIGTHT